jgi:hypothetical protein
VASKPTREVELQRIALGGVTQRTEVKLAQATGGEHGPATGQGTASGLSDKHDLLKVTAGHLLKSRSEASWRFRATEGGHGVAAMEELTDLLEGRA